MNTTDELLPCPFCGGKARIDGMLIDSGHNDPFYVAQVRCVECGATVEEADRPSGRDGKSAAVDAAAIATWNRRSIEYRKPTTLSQLESENASLGGAVQRLGRLCDDYKAENAKLRELIEDLQVAPCCGSACWMKLADRMRELGIEVDG